MRVTSSATSAAAALSRAAGSTNWASFPLNKPIEMIADNNEKKNTKRKERQIERVNKLITNGTNPTGP